MSICLYGSQKKTSAPASFSIDSGAICFVLGLDNVICPLLDRIPAVVGKPWKEIIQTVARDGLGLAVDLITGQIDTSSFCSSPAPALPSDITYADVFNFIASYVPPFSIVASSNNLLDKIAKYYLYDKWFVHCECKNKELEPPPNAPSPVPPFVGACANSSAHQLPVNQAINGVNSHNSSGVNQEVRWDMLNSAIGFLQTYQSKAEYEAHLANFRDGTPIMYEEAEIYYPANQSTQNSTFGCLKMTRSGGNENSYSITFRPDFYGSPSSDTYVMSRYIKTAKRISWNESDCCPPPPPPPRPVLPPPPQNCVPVPPPRYCELFPNDPMCANVPENSSCPPCPPVVSPTSIQVIDYDCTNLSINKNVLWNL